MIDFGRGLKKAFEDGEWSMFMRITTEYFCKECYSLESNGTVYSRYSGKTLENKEAAYNEFIEDMGYAH